MSQIDTFEAMLARGQDSEMLRYTLGNAYFKQEDYAHAVMHLQQATTLKPDYSAAFKLLGRAFHAMGNLDEAIEVFNRGLEVAEKNGDKQTAKEIEVFRKRALKSLHGS